MSLKPEDHRGGLLTMGAVLGLTSDGTRHRPVHRGVWISEAIFNKMVREEAELRKLPEKYKQLIRNETAFMDLLKQAHAEHDEALQREGLK